MEDLINVNGIMCPQFGCHAIVFIMSQVSEVALKLIHKALKFFSMVTELLSGRTHVKKSSIYGTEKLLFQLNSNFYLMK